MPAETSQTLDRGLGVLSLLAESGDGMTVTEIAAALQVSRTVVYRLVVTLEQHALLRRGADGRCRLGMAVLALARQVQPVLRDAAVPALRRLADQVGATSHLTVVDGSDALAVAVVEPTRSDVHVAYRVGTRHSLDRGAAGKAVLAARATGGRPFEPGWIASAGELQPGAFGVAAPLLGVAGIEASVGVVTLSELTAEDVGPKVLRAAGEVARALR
ncbi:MAG TPA: helix-turn-helix domain-containing protein [Candidatus Nanopelagicales bacterium]|nr:helix-turn-helix domain-containing protein [Candidatus Nanopelagicales bacterium]